MDIQILRSCRFSGVDYSSGLFTAALGNAYPDVTANFLIAQGVALDLSVKNPAKIVNNIEITTAQLAVLNSTYSAGTPPPDKTVVYKVSDVNYVWNGTTYAASSSGGGSSSSYAFTPFSKADQADTPASNKTTITPTVGAGIVRLDYTKTTNTPKGTAMYVVFNALNSTDADTKLGSDATRFTIAIGTNREFQFAVGSECTRIDFITNAATPETATSTLITGEYGVLA